MGKDNQQTDFQLSRRQKLSRCAGPLHKPLVPFSGATSDEDILRLNQAILVFLGLAVAPRSKREAS